MVAEGGDLHLLGDASKAESFWREPEFRLLLVAAFASTFVVPWWTVLLPTVSGLSISSPPKYKAVWARAKAAGVESKW
jgi:hypothetical protein